YDQSHQAGASAVSLHAVRVPSPSEVLAASDKPISKSFKTTLAVLFAIGVVVFIIGLFAAPDRVWRAWHTNWLFFAGISSAGTVFVAVQRVTTARWSRNVIRFMEGYVAFLPVAFVFLLLTLFAGKLYVFHSTHSLQGKLAAWQVVLYGLGWSVLAWDLSMGLSLHFQSTLYSWWFFMGA